MFGLKWPWTARRERLEREAAQRAAMEERQRNIELARDSSRAFVAEQQRLAAVERQKRAKQGEVWDEPRRRQVIADMSAKRAQTHVSPRPPARRAAPQPVTTQTDTGTRVVWDEPMHMHLVQPSMSVMDSPPPITMACASDPEPEPIRGGGGTFDGGGASGDWSSSSSSDSGGSSDNSSSSGGGMD